MSDASRIYEQMQCEQRGNGELPPEERGDAWEGDLGGSPPDGDRPPLFPDPKPFSQLEAEAEDLPQLWQSYLRPRAITLLSSAPKCGKTTLVSHLFRAFASGGDFCDRIVAPARVLVVSEESEGQWLERGQPLGFGDHLEFLCRPFLRRADHVAWLAFLVYVAQLTKTRSYGLVVFDTLGSLWPVANENDAGEVQAALVPLHGITAHGAGVLLTHHLRKSGGDEGSGSRGSSALPGFVDCLLELKRLNPSDTACRKRVLTGYARWTVPAESVIEWDVTAGQYVALGQKNNVRTNDMIEIIKSILPTEAPGIDSYRISEAWPGQTSPRRTNLLATLNQGFEQGHWIRYGNGRKGSPYTFWIQRPSEDSVSVPVPI